MHETETSRTPMSDPLQDPLFAAIHAACRDATMTSVERMYALYRAILIIVRHEVPGDFVECGVWRGGSVMLMALTLAALGCTDRAIWLYDTFEGMPPPSDIDRDAHGQTAQSLLQAEARSETSLIWSYAPREVVARNLARTGYPQQLLRFVEGKVEETAHKQRPEQIALLRLDTDWYESTRCELDVLYPRLVPGGALIIDDYGHWQGARRAVDEYFAGQRDPVVFHPIDYTGRLRFKRGEPLQDDISPLDALCAIEPPEQVRARAEAARRVLGDAFFNATPPPREASDGRVARQLSPDEAAELAARYHEQGDLTSADALCQAVLTLKPDHAQALLRGGMIAAQTLRFDAAEVLLRRATEASPTNKAAWNLLAVALKENGKHDDAQHAQARAAAMGRHDYIAPHFEKVFPDIAFPNKVEGDPDSHSWAYLRKEIAHRWYVDRRSPTVGFLSRDEAHILYNTARMFEGQHALEIGCWFGWSACHLALGGLRQLDIVDPLLASAVFYDSVSSSLAEAGALPRCSLYPGKSPQRVQEIAQRHQKRWPLIFIDGDHEGAAPLNDAITCAALASDDAMILFHDLASPDVAAGLDHLREQGWQTKIYHTMQIMGVAWRGAVRPVEHIADPAIAWSVPAHLRAHL